MVYELSQYSLALFHLLNHALFKALLFLAAGAIIHAMSDEQDVRRMGGLILLLPHSYAFVLLGSLSLMAFPFLTGFYSKDLILELALIPRGTSYTIAYILALVAAILTATYSVRTIIITFISTPNMPRTLLTTIHDPSLSMFIPLIILSIGSTFAGYITHDLFLGVGSTFYLNALFTHPNHATAMIDSPLAAATIFAYLPLAISFIAIFALLPISFKGIYPTTNVVHKDSNILPADSMIAVAPLYYKTPKGALSNSKLMLNLSKDNSPFSLKGINSTMYSVYLYTVILNHYNIFNQWIVYTFLNVAVHIYRYFDKGLILLLGPIGLVRLFHYLSHQLELLSTGFIPHYAFIIISFLLLIIILLILIPAWPSTISAITLLELIALVLLLFFVLLYPILLCSLF